MNRKSANTYRVEICLAGNEADAMRICREFCLSTGLCVTVTPSEFIYTGGQEAGVIVRLLNYPKFPSTPTQIWETAKSLADNLRRGLFQDSVLLVGDDRTEWVSMREGGNDG